MVTKRIARVVVENQTGIHLRSASVVHKYSDNYVNKGTVTHLPPGATCEVLTAEYHTGFLTTGQDWWFVLFSTSDGHTHKSHPNNFRNIIDNLESGAAAIGAAVGAAVGAALTAGAGATTGAEIGAAFAELLHKTGILNSGKTAEGDNVFKKYFLEAVDDQDDGGVVKIVLKGLEGSDNLGIVSPSDPKGLWTAVKLVSKYDVPRNVIQVRAGLFVDRLTITGHTPVDAGGSGGDVYEAWLKDDEYIIKVFGKRGFVIDSIGFVTNHGRVVGPFGGPGGDPFEYQVPGQRVSSISADSCDFGPCHVVKNVNVTFVL